MPEGPRSVPPLERLLHVKRIPLLSGLDAAEVAALADAAVERFFPKGAVVLREGDQATAIHFVVEGALANFRGGRQVGVIGPGGGVGGLPVLARESMGSHVVAEQDTLTLEVDADAMADVLEDRFPILQHLLREVSRQALAALRGLSLDPTRFFPQSREATPAGADFDLVDRLLLMRQMPAFERTSVTTLAELARTLVSVRLDPDTLLWHEGEAAHSILFLSSGAVQALGSGGVSFTAGPGFPLGALEAVGQLPRWYEARVALPTLALQCHTDVLVDLFEDNFEMATDYLAIVARATLRILEWSAAQVAGTPEG